MFVFYQEYSDEAAFVRHGENLCKHGDPVVAMLDGLPAVISLGGDLR